MVSIKVNNKRVFLKKGSTLFQACMQVGFEVPKFCYHDRLIIAGNCRICLVEVTKQIKPIAACAIPVGAGIEIFTNSPLVKKSREQVIEFLLLNHPLDCPICDQGGECDLQNYSLSFGSDFSRFFFSKRNVFNYNNIGPLVKTVINRCIHCTRCVRFLKNYAGFNHLGIFGRGSVSEIGLFQNTKKYKLFTFLSGNIIDLCPVGSITFKKYDSNSY